MAHRSVDSELVNIEPVWDAGVAMGHDLRDRPHHHLGGAVATKTSHEILATGGSDEGTFYLVAGGGDVQG